MLLALSHSLFQVRPTFQAGRPGPCFPPLSAPEGVQLLCLEVGLPEQIAPVAA